MKYTIELKNEREKDHLIEFLGLQCAEQSN